jgi:hypothetical protein
MAADGGGSTRVQLASATHEILLYLQQTAFFSSLACARSRVHNLLAIFFE